MGEKFSGSRTKLQERAISLAYISCKKTFIFNVYSIVIFHRNFRACRNVSVFLVLFSRMKERVVDTVETRTLWSKRIETRFDQWNSLLLAVNCFLRYTLLSEVHRTPLSLRQQSVPSYLSRYLSILFGLQKLLPLSK